MNQAAADLLRKETQQYEEAVTKAWNYLYGDGADPVAGQGWATLAVAHASLMAALIVAERGR